MPTMPPLPAALIFDFDGLIADTEAAVYTTWNELYTRHGETLSLVDWAQCVGSDWNAYNPADELDRRTGKKLDWDTLKPELSAREAEILADLQPLPGVCELLAEATAAEMPCAIASSSPHEWVDPWIEKFALGSHFQHVVCLEDTGVPKPDPALFLEAAKRLGVEPATAIVFEDSLNGLRAAQAAGSPCVIVPNSTTQHLDFTGAALQLKSLAEVDLAGLTKAVAAK